MSLSKILLSLFLSVSSVANADILFLDMNKAPLEIAAAKRAAAARGEKLIVIPAPGNSSSGMTIEQFGQELQLLKAQKVSLSSVVVSGHDGNGNFSGDNGSLSATHIRDAFEKAKPVGDNVRSLLLWGCYTTTPGSIEFRWKNALPNVSAVIGFDGSAPSKERLGSHTYLEDYLKREESLLKIRDARQLAAAYNSIRNIKLMKSAACINDTYLTPTTAPRTMQSILGSCMNVPATTKESEQFTCYFESKPGCETIPANTPQSPLRVYYNHLQATSHCNDQLLTASIYRADPDSVIRLILFDNVVTNFQKLNSGEIAHINKMLEDAQAPAELRIGDLTKMNRSDIRKLLGQVKSALTVPNEILYKDNSDSEIEAIAGRVATFDMASKMGSTLHSLGTGCVPFEWVEPNARGTSSCIPQMKDFESVKSKEVSALHRRAVRKSSEEIEKKVLASPAGAEYHRVYARAIEARTDEETQKLYNEIDRVYSEQIQTQIVAELERLASLPETSEIRRREIQNHIRDVRRR